jgi:hypothetical protein
MIFLSHWAVFLIRERSFPVRGFHIARNRVAMKTKELTLKQILSVPCPTCGAATEESCELHSGAPRTEPHRDRKLSAAEAVETKPLRCYHVA